VRCQAQEDYQGCHQVKGVYLSVLVTRFYDRMDFAGWTLWRFSDISPLHNSSSVISQLAFNLVSSFLMRRCFLSHFLRVGTLAPSVSPPVACPLRHSITSVLIHDTPHPHLDTDLQPWKRNRVTTPSRRLSSHPLQLTSHPPKPSWTMIPRGWSRFAPSFPRRITQRCSACVRSELV
jgi:hypothetical protein